MTAATIIVNAIIAIIVTVVAVCDVPYIVPRGRKGGSNIAATICNSMIYYKG